MPDKRLIQLIWGAALLAMGVGLMFKIPQVMPRIKTIEYYVRMAPFIRFGLYLIGIILIGGGAKKLYTHLKGTGEPDPPE